MKYKLTLCISLPSLHNRNFISLVFPTFVSGKFKMSSFTKIFPIREADVRKPSSFGLFVHSIILFSSLHNEFSEDALNNIINGMKANNVNMIFV